MKRDMGLIRALLLEAEGDQTVDLSAFSKLERAYHFQLLLDAGFVEGKVRMSGMDGKLRPIGYRVQRLTWSGHEFMDAARNESVWKRVTAKVTKTGATVSLAILQELLVQELRRIVGLKA